MPKPNKRKNRYDSVAHAIPRIQASEIEERRLAELAAEMLESWIRCEWGSDSNANYAKFCTWLARCVKRLPPKRLP